MHVAMVYLSGGGLSGGATTTLRSQVPLLLDDERISRLDLFLPKDSAGLDDLPVQPYYWDRRDRYLGCPGLRRDILSTGADVVFIPNAAWLDCGNVPTVCMVRNMEALTRPIGGNPLWVGVKNFLRAFVARRACRRSSRIIAVSHFVRDYLIGMWGIEEAKIGVVYHGVSSPPAEDEIRKPAGLGPAPAEPYWFTAGSLMPYRGLEDAIGALARRPLEEVLVIAGGPVYSEVYQHRMQRLAASLGLADRVIWLGNIPPEEMSWCYRHCRGFLMTSRLEACPNVALEALAHGCAIISDRNPPMPEIFDDAALYYSAGDVNRLRHCMRELADTQSATMRALREGADRRARKFTWRACCENTVAQLQLALQTAGSERGAS